MFGRLLKTRCVGVLAVAKITSPSVSKLTVSQDVVSRFVTWGYADRVHHV
jgi:hypothetical protein